MKSSGDTCFICCKSSFKIIDKNYKECEFCGHQILNSKPKQTFIINDILHKSKIKKDFLFIFKKFVTLKCADERETLIDVGSGSGSFIFFMKKHFNKVIGIEVTDECYNFSKNILEVETYKSLNEIKGTFSIATFWHSLEHIPGRDILNILNILNKLSSESSRIIVSVPNGKSIQYKIFKSKYAYYDYPNHIHQFNYNSLCMLFRGKGFILKKEFYSFYYIFFGYVQGFLNMMNNIHNYFYYRKKRGINFNLSKVKTTVLNIYNILLIFVFILPSFLLTIAEYFIKEKRSVLTLCFQKKKD